MIRAALRKPAFTTIDDYIDAYPAHIGLYPGPAAVAAFSRELDAFRTTKGAIQFPHDARLPLELIAKIVKSCVAARRQALARVRAKPPR